MIFGTISFGAVFVAYKMFSTLLSFLPIHILIDNWHFKDVWLLVIWWWGWWGLLLYSAVLCSRADSLHSHVILHQWLAFYSVFLNIHWSGVLTALAWLVWHETAAILVQVLWTPYNHAPCHFMQSHIRKVHACSVVTCHLHFWQNDGDRLHATAVTRGWNGYRNKSQHRKLTLEKKTLPPLLQGFEPATFQSRVRRSNHWAIPSPDHWKFLFVMTAWDEGRHHLSTT